jgi:hypothetical protein
MMKKSDNFAVFILSHGRADNVMTHKTLRKIGYTGKIYIIIDDEDETADRYFEIFGKENVIQFNKQKASKIVDVGDSIQNYRGVVYARNQSQIIAKEMGLDYMIQLDDDYNSFAYRYPKNNKLALSRITKNMDAICKAMIQFLEDTNAATVAMAQAGEFIGGIESSAFTKVLHRKAMNSFFFRTDKFVEFSGRINEDVNAYIRNGAFGDLYFTVTNLMLTQMQTQKNKGGLTEIYLDAGTYVKSFYTVMMAPSCVKIGTIGIAHPRFHHAITWNNAVPKIISGKYRKPSDTVMRL